MTTNLTVLGLAAIHGDKGGENPWVFVYEFMRTK